MKKRLSLGLVLFLIVLSVFVSADSSDEVKEGQCAGFFNWLKCLFSREEALAGK